MIWKILLKDLKIILRTPLTIIILILIPIILMFLVGLAFSGNDFTTLNLGFINTDENELFKFNNQVKTIPYKHNNLSIAKKNCIRDMDLNKIHLCVYVNFTKVENSTLGADIEYYIDNTRLQISEIIASALDKQINKKEREISISYLNIVDKELENSITYVETFIPFIENTTYEIEKIEKNITDFKKILNSKKDIYTKEVSNFIEIIEYLESNEKQVEDIKENINSTLQDSKDLIDVINNTLSSRIITINSLLLILENSLPNDTSPAVLLVKDISETFSEIESNLNELLEIREQLSEVQEYLSDFDTLYSKREFVYLLPEKISDGLEGIEKVEDNLEEVLIMVEQNKEKLDSFKDEINENIENVQTLSENFEPISILDPLKVTRVDRFENITKVHQMAPVVVMMVILFVGCLLSTTIVSLEVDSKAYGRNLFLPISQSKFIAALVITCFLISYLEVLVLFFILFQFFNIQIFENFLQLNLIVFHIMLVFILFGIFIGYVFKNRQLAILISTFFAIGLFLISNIILPIELMPKIFSYFVSYNPVVIGNELLRQLFFYSGFNLEIRDFLFIYLYIFLLVGGIQYAYKKREREFNL